MKIRIPHQIALSGLFLALGIVLPYITAHVFGMPGTLFLPMHIPVLLAGLICGPLSGGVIGAILPLLSSLVMGMPSIFPMMPIMAFQLFIMGFLSGLLHRRFNLSTYISLILSLVLGWASYWLMFVTLSFIVQVNIKALSLSAALIQGIPGIVIQLILVPIIVAAIEKRFPGSKQDRKNTCFEKALQLIQSGKKSLVIISSNRIVYMVDGRGVSPLLKLYDEDPKKLERAFVVDKIIGKAAAMILFEAKAKEVYGEIMSVAACNYLKEKNIDFRFGECADVIASKNMNGICPIERSVLDIDDSEEGIRKIRETIYNLSAQKRSC